MFAWPFVARDSEIRQSLEALAEGSGLRGVVLTGEAGAGKTALARTLADELGEQGFKTRFVLGTRTGQEIPFGAFHHLLTIEVADEPAAVLAAAHRALAHQERLVVVVDDAQFLDPLSALFIYQLAASGSTKFIITIRSGEKLHDAVVALWKERLLRHLDVELFRRSQTEELLCAVLDGEIDEHLVDSFHELTAGNPFALRGLLTTSVESGTVTRAQDRWCIRGALRVGAEVGDLVGSRLDPLTKDEREVVELVCIAEVLDWCVLRGLCDADAIAGAERSGVIAVIDDGTGILARPAHPFIGEIVRERCGTARTRHLNTTLARHLSRHHRRATVRPADTTTDVRNLLQLAQFMMHSDLDPDLGVILDAAAGAVAMANLALGEQLARFALDRGGGLGAAVALADAVSWAGRGLEAETILSEFDPDGDELDVVRWGCLRAANLFFGCGDRDAAEAVLATVRQRVRSELLLTFVTSIQVAIAFFAADMTVAVGTGLAVLKTEIMPTASVWAAMASAGALAMTGRYGEVPAIAAQGLAAAEHCQSGPQRYSLGLAEVLACIGAGDLPAAQRSCDRYAAMTSGVPQAEAIVSALRGRLDLARGDLPSACRALRHALWSMSESLPPGWVMLVASWLTQSEAARGNPDGAAAALAKAEDANGPQIAVFSPELELARAWERASAGEITSARMYATRAAQLARHHGMHAVEVDALHCAVRFGDRSWGPRLRQLARLVDSPLPTAVWLHSAAFGDHDGGRIDQAADLFTSMGMLALAADASAQSAREHARGGARVHELESAMRAHWLASQWEIHTPATDSVERPLPITDREREIANLVGAGLTNREIADRLGVSVRTIDGHLYRIYTKLQIEDRDQLTRLVRIQRA